jgi:hypothetical protein
MYSIDDQATYNASETHTPPKLREVGHETFRYEIMGETEQTEVSHKGTFKLKDQMNLSSRPKSDSVVFCLYIQK